MSSVNSGTCAETNPRNGRTETSVRYKSCHVAQLVDHTSRDKRWFESTQGNLALCIEPIINAYPWREKKAGSALL